MRKFIFLFVSLMAFLTVTGCTVVAAVATGAADAKQQPVVKSFLTKKPVDRVFVAAVQAMGNFGKILSQDKTSGTIQGEKGSWVMNVTILKSGSDTNVQVSARFVPSNRMDFNSREELTATYVKLLETNLGDKFTLSGN